MLSSAATTAGAPPATDFARTSNLKFSPTLTRVVSVMEKWTTVPSGLRSTLPGISITNVGNIMGGVITGVGVTGVTGVGVTGVGFTVIGFTGVINTDEGGADAGDEEVGDDGVSGTNLDNRDSVTLLLPMVPRLSGLMGRLNVIDMEFITFGNVYWVPAAGDPGEGK